MKRGYVDTPEGQIHYRIEGKGRPVLLLHRVGLSSDEFTEMLPLLSQNYLVVAMDILGYGNSDMPSNPIQIEDYARNVIHFLDTLDIKKADVLGSRFGSSIAVEMAAAYPSRVNKLMLIGCIYAEPEQKEKLLDFYRNKRMERQIKEDGSHLMEHWKERVSLLYANFELRQRHLVEYLRPGLGTKDEDGHLALFSYDIGSRLPAVKSPTLLIYTAGDKWLRRIEAVKNLIPKCRTKILADSGQVPTWENPQEYSQAVLEFLENPER
jgi:pimeloyl-ACP methyl ester carboxylesterase